MAGEETAETKFCSNCKKDIAASNFLMHEAHCRRHIILCEICQEPVPRSEKDQHFTELHAKVKCPQCSQELEKDKLEQHLDSQCRKRMVTCEFCELQLPCSELDGHTDYCGSRTEPCPKCLQYIMMKDQAQHEASSCQFPTPKPPASSSNGAGPGLDRDGRGVLQPELERLQEDSWQPMQFTRPDSFFSAMDFGERFPGTTNGSQSTASRAAAIQNRLLGASVERKPTNRKSNVNRERDRHTGRSGMDMDEASDRLLAMRLQQEEDAMVEQMLRDLQKNGSDPQNSSHPTSPNQISPGTDTPNTFQQEDACIPCEFCGDSMPVDILFEHQSRCDPLASGMFEPLPISSPVERNNEIHGRDLARFRRNDAIPVINNLENDTSPFMDPRSASPPVEMFADSEEESVMLPCEFCMDQFPGEMLVMHQSVCEHNPLSTPRVQTPVVPGQSNLRKTNFVSSTADNILENFTSRSRTQRYQPPPDIPPDHLYEDMLSRQIQEMFENPPSPDDLYSPQSAASSDNSLQATMQRYGVSSDRNIDVFARPPRSGSRNLQDNAGNLRGAPRKHAVRSERKPNPREVLSQLMSAEVEEGESVGRNVNPQHKSTKNQDNAVRRSSLNNLSGPGSSGRRQSGPDARFVQRQLEGTGRMPNSRQHSRNYNGPAGRTTDAGAGGDTTGAARPRQRGDHVFNHNSRSQPPAGQNPAPSRPRQQGRAPFQGQLASQDVRRTNPNPMRQAPRRDTNL